MRQGRNVLIALVVLGLSAGFSAAQSTAASSGGDDKAKIKWLQPTLQGTTGLFEVYSGETLRKGEFSIQGGVSNYDRSPGNLDITVAPFSFTLGLADRVEWAIGWYPYKKVRAIGPLRGYYNETPFLLNPGNRVVEGDGISDFFTSVKFNLMSQTRNQPFGMAVRFNLKLPTSAEGTTRRLRQEQKGLTTGVPDGGVDVIFSKWAGPATVMLNAGVQGIGEHTSVRELQSEIRYGAGLAIGNHPVQGIFELTGKTFFGSKGPNNFNTNPRSPVDLVFGMRFLPAKWISIGAGYRLNARTWSADNREPSRSGFVGNVAINRKINRPPTAECTIDMATIQQRGRATVRVMANDPDDSNLTITWRTSGGRISESGDSATFETGDLSQTAPGRYSITAEVSDGENVATCSVDVVVEKLKIAPKVACAPASATVKTGETTTIQATATDENPGDTLTYTWEVDGQRVAESGSSFTFGTTGRNPGRHTVRVTVTDPDGMTANCESTVEIQAPPPPPQVNRAPTCQMTLSPTDVYSGASVRATARATDPDNDTLSYEWSIDGRVLSGMSGSEANISTADVGAGSHSVSLKVSDGKGLSETCSASFTVRGKIVIELPRLRIDNAAKAKLDDVALQMQNDSRLTALITGFDVAQNARVADQNGLRIARLARNYLIQQHKIDAGRIEAKSGGKGTPRRIEIDLTSR